MKNFITPLENAKNIESRKDLLKKELIESKKWLVDKYRAEFKKYSFDFENKCLISKTSNLKLQWKPRMFPDREESYTNQQTNREVVILERIMGE